MNAQKGYSLIWIAAVALMLGGLLVLVAPSAQSQQQTQFTIVARDMAYVLLDSGGSATEPINGPIIFPAGRRISITFRNEDPGMKHDLVLDALDRRTELLSAGQQARLIFTTPDRPVDGDYYCSTHARTMRGKMQVR